jgi:hypothetical protein
MNCTNLICFNSGKEDCQSHIGHILNSLNSGYDFKKWEIQKNQLKPATSLRAQRIVGLVTSSSSVSPPNAFKVPHARPRKSSSELKPGEHLN